MYRADFDKFDVDKNGAVEGGEIKALAAFQLEKHIDAIDDPLPLLLSVVQPKRSAPGPDKVAEIARAAAPGGVLLLEIDALHREREGLLVDRIAVVSQGNLVIQAIVGPFGGAELLQ